MRFTKTIPSETRQAIADAYASGLTSPAVARMFDTDHSVVRYIVRELGGEVRSMSVSHRTFSINEQAFDTITDESAYWVGFLMADGCVFDGASRGITVSLKGDDRPHLEKLRRFLGSTHPIKEVRPKHYAKSWNSSPQCCLTIVNARLAMALSRFGVVPRKSATARAIGLEHNSHFWRGVVDGDGWICFPIRRWNRGNPNLGLVGAFPLLSQFRDFIEAQTGIRRNVLAAKAIWRVAVSGMLAKHVAEILYKDAPVALDRKSEKAALAMQYTPYRRQITTRFCPST